jgi:hypothetical protein
MIKLKNFNPSSPPPKEAVSESNGGRQGTDYFTNWKKHAKMSVYGYSFL